MAFGQSLGQLILDALDDGEKSMKELYQAVPGKRSSIDKARQRLLKAGEIEKVSQGVYRKKQVLTGGGGAEISKNVSEQDKNNDWETLIGDAIESACPIVDGALIAQGEKTRERLRLLHAYFSSCANLVAGVCEVADKIEREKTPETFIFENLFQGENAMNMELKLLVNILFLYWEQNGRD